MQKRNCSEADITNPLRNTRRKTEFFLENDGYGFNSTSSSIELFSSEDQKTRHFLDHENKVALHDIHEQDPIGDKSTHILQVDKNNRIIR